MSQARKIRRAKRKKQLRTLTLLEAPVTLPRSELLKLARARNDAVDLMRAIVDGKHKRREIIEELQGYLKKYDPKPEPEPDTGSRSETDAETPAPADAEPV